MLADTQPLPFNRSHEYGSSIIEAIVMHRPTVIYGNVRNTGMIDNLLPDGCVEVACLVDQNGVQPCPFWFSARTTRCSQSQPHGNPHAHVRKFTQQK